MPNSKTLGRPVEILLIDDSPSDALLTKEALKHGTTPNNFHHVKDGPSAMAYLQRRGEFAAATRPDLVLLDLDMPGMDGRDVLRAIRSDDALKNLTVVVLTTSSAREDIASAYELLANCYITKPVDMKEFAQAMRAFDEFWLTWAALPSA